MNERTPMELNDEILCAYIDGELDQEMRGRVQEFLAGDSEARVRLVRMRNADVSLREAFRMPAVQPNDALREHITKSPAVALGMPRFAIRRTAVWAALAAGIGGIVVGYSLPSAADRVDGTRLAFVSSDALSQALETQASGHAVKDNATSIEVQLTFSANDGRYCRVVRVESTRESTDAIACRDAGRWQVLALDATAGRGGEFRTAGASELIDGAMDHLGGSAPLEPQQEQTVIEQHWKLNSGARR